MSELLEGAARSALYAALAAPVGLILRTESTWRAKAVLYRVRKEIADPALNVIQVRLSPDDPEHELWLVKVTSAEQSVAKLDLSVL